MTLQIFVTVASTYFAYLRKSMNSLASLDGGSAEQRQLRTAWKFTVATAIVVTMTGFVYATASVLTVAFPTFTLKTALGLQVVTLLSLYGEGFFGMLGCVLGLVQVLFGSQRDNSLGTASNTGAHHNTNAAASRSGKRGFGLSSTFSSSGFGGGPVSSPTEGHIRVQVQTRTMVESENDGRPIVQLELDSYSKSGFEKDDKYDGRY